MKRIFLILAAALAASNATAADSLTMADFNHSIKLQVAGYTGTETLQNFPVLVRVSETRIPGFRFADMSPHATTKKWGRIVPTKVVRRIQNVWTEDGTNTVGTGFWYYRTANDGLKIKFEASK